MQKNIVIFGGGNGLSTTLKAIKDIKDIKISAIVTVADSGGSTGEIRKYYKTPALGDLRRVLVSMAKKETVLNDLMNYRFKSNNDNDPLNNHSLGNLIMLAVNELNGFYNGVKYLSDIFKVNGEIIPLTDNADCELIATYDDGSVEKGENFIPQNHKRIKTINYVNEESIDINPRIVDAINQADLIVFSFGSLYTSIIASMALPKVKKALIDNKDKKFAYLCNLMTQPGETQNMTVLNHVDAIEKMLEPGIIDYVLVNNRKPKKELIDKYAKVGSSLLLPTEELNNYCFDTISFDLIDYNNNEVIKHDIKKIKKAFKLLLETMEK